MEEKEGGRDKAERGTEEDAGTEIQRSAGNTTTSTTSSPVTSNTRKRKEK